MDNIEIRKINILDVVELQLLSRKTFIETFAAHNTVADMQEYLNNNLSIDKLKLELYTLNSEFYFISQNNTPMGYLKINFGQAQTELQDQSSLEIERIYILKDFLGNKMGQTLFNKAISRAKTNNLDFVWLGVWEKNETAIGFYKKNGLVAFDQHVFRLGNDEQTDIMMRLDLIN